MSAPIIQARALSRWYGEVIGLNMFNVDIMPGITGIVGPNGAGKSTLFKLICGLIRPSVGDVLVLGQRPWRNRALLARIGLCPDYDNLPAELTGEQFLAFCGGLHGMSGSALDRRIAEVVGIVGLKKSADRAVGGYSKGMRQRIKIAAAMLHGPELLLLDEPLSGTDPVGRRDLIDLVKSLNRDHGHNVIVSSHVLYEIERLTTNVAVVYKGRAVASGDISYLRGLIDSHPHRIIVESPRAAELASAMVGWPCVISVEKTQTGSGVIVQVARPDEFFGAFAELVRTTGARVDRLESLDDNLEAVFKYLVGW